MTFSTARKYGFVVSHTGRRVGLAALLLALGSLIPQNASAETRTLRLHNIHTHEDLTIAYKKDGRFDEEALKKLNAYFRDWRKEQEVKMDPRLFDMLWEVHRDVKASGPIHVVCGYRSPSTNAMLRSRSGGVARTSLHMQGKAIDFSIPSAEVADVRAAALRIQGGGVGYYPTSGIPFVHMDVGNVRHWPRMTRDQLVKVFPNGRTLHVPTDGHPLPGYELAAADASRRSSETRQPRSLIAALFNGAKDSEEAADETPTPSRSAAPAATAARRPAPAPAPERAPAVETAAATPIPLPQSRPTFQIAAATAPRLVPAPAAPAAAPVPAAAPTAPAPKPVDLASLSPNQIIDARGYWQGLPETAPEAQANASGARRAAPTRTASADPDVTGVTGPFARPDLGSEVALSYAAPSEPSQASSLAERFAPAVVTTKGTASVAAKPALPAAATPAQNIRAAKAGERVNDPWLRGVVMAPSLQTSMTTTQFGAPDFRTLRPFIQKPPAAVMMTFSADPNLGMTTDSFTGSAVVFQSTVSFGMRTAMLLQ